MSYYFIITMDARRENKTTAAVVVFKVRIILKARHYEWPENEHKFIINII